MVDGTGEDGTGEDGTGEDGMGEDVVGEDGTNGKGYTEIIILLLRLRDGLPIF